MMQRALHYEDESRASRRALRKTARGIRIDRLGFSFTSTLGQRDASRRTIVNRTGSRRVGVGSRLDTNRRICQQGVVSPDAYAPSFAQISSAL